MSLSVKLRTSPSNIAKIMESGCQRSLYFYSISEQNGANKDFLKNYHGLDIDRFRREALVKNQFRQDAGNDLEIDILMDQNIPEKLQISTYGVKGHYYPKVTSNTEKVKLENTFALLAELADPDAFEKKHQIADLRYLYQLTFVPTEDFKKKYSFDPLFDFNWSNPDLIRITREPDGILLSVIDIKMAEHIRLKQKLQVTLYALLLDSMVKELAKDHDMHTVRVDLKQGYIWHKGQPAPTVFDMEEVLPYVERFLKVDVRALTDRVREAFCAVDSDPSSFPEQLSHRLCSHCEYCDYIDYCLAQGRKAGDYQRIPYLSSYGQRCIEELAAKSRPDAPATMTCAEAGRVLKEQMEIPEIAASIRRNPSLREYSKESGNGLLIDRYQELLAMTEKFDYRAGRELAQRARKNAVSADEILTWLSALEAQKEQDLDFLRDRLEKLQKSPEPSSYQLDYQQKKCNEAESVKTLARSIAQRLQSGESPQAIAQDLGTLAYRNLAPKSFLVRGRALLDFPQGTSGTVALYLSAQKDEISGRMFALAYSYMLPKKAQLPELAQIETCALIADSEADTDRIEQEFIHRLYRLFHAIHDYNWPAPAEDGAGSDPDPASQLRLQCFVMDPYEADNLMEYFYDMLERSDASLAEEVMDILSWLQDERMADQDQSRQDIICDHPFVSLTQAVRRTFLLPAEIAYSFDDIAALFVVERPFRKNIGYFSNHFSNSISAGFVREHWKNPSEEKFAVDKLESELRNRLIQESLIRDGVLNELNTETALTGKRYLPSYAPIFCLPGHNRYAHPLLSRLDFQQRYEEMLKRLKTRNARVGDIPDLITDNVITPVRYLGSRETSGCDFYGHPLELHDFEIIEPNAGLTVPDMGLTFSAATENALLEFLPHEFKKRDNHVNAAGYWGGFSQKAELEDNILHLTLEHREAIPFEERMLCYMFERYTDWSSPSILGGYPTANSRSPYRGILKDIDEDCLAEDVISLLEDPCAFVLRYKNALATSESPAHTITAEESLRYEKTYFEYCFVPSQQNAFLQFYNQNLSLVQGPPGTGKTNFIAMSVLIYLIRQQELGAHAKKIFITSNSHVALENVLHKIDELLGYMDRQAIDLDLPLAIYQVGGGETDSDRIRVIKKESIGRNDYKGYDSIIFDEEEDHVILGATVWALERAFQRHDLQQKRDVFDVAIVDEASQVRLIDSTIALAHVKKDGKILLVGDHEQLPPIIQGVYETKEDKPFTAGSVFQYFIDHDLIYRKNHGALLYSKRLNEQFRMNEILSRYPSQQIYEGDYRPANDAIAAQKLRLAPPETYRPADMAALCDWLLDPEYPFVLCNIRNAAEGGFLSADAKKNFEIELVKQLSDCCIHRLYRDQKGSDTALYDNAEEFWHEGMFIIAPHHEHINRLRNALKDLPDFGEHAFIDTVDKMQGQEAEIALVSYGISDEEQALREKEFVFNRNRLNVSITRGKRKMILILTDVLTDKQLELMAEEDQQLIDSIAFMNGIKTFAAEKDHANPSPLKDDWVQNGMIVLETYRKKSI